MSWQHGPMVAFDLETDSPDPEDARIVTACVALIDGAGQTPPSVVTWMLKPVRPIPEQASEIHGITTEQAQADGMDPAMAVQAITATLADHIEDGAPVVAFNAAYDLTVLDREARRHDVPSLADRCADDRLTLHVVDPFVLDNAVDQYRRGKRTLAACCQEYGVYLDGAHNASFDAIAAARVAWRIAQRYPHIAGMPLADLHAFQTQAKRDQDASFAQYLRGLAAKERDVDEQIALMRKAEGCRGHWPLIPYQSTRAET